MRSLILVAGMLILPATMLPQQLHPHGWAAAVAAMDRYVASDQIVGSGLAIIDDGKVIAEHYTGFADRAAGKHADHGTIWHWGSITKTLTAVRFMQLDMDRTAAGITPRLLNQPVAQWVPELARIHSDYAPMTTVTARMLLSHSSGLQDPTWPWSKGRSWEPFEPTEWSQLVAMMPYMQLRFAPGTRYSYSNPGFIYLAREMQAITGDPWEGMIYKTLLMPLGMQASYFGITPRQLRQFRSHNYSVDSSGAIDHGADFDPGITIPNGGWNAPISDLARWLGFLEGSSDAATQDRYDQILPRSVLHQMWQPVVRVDDEEQMGLSFFLRHVDGKLLIGHTGTQANFRSFFWVDPASHRAVIGVVNTSSDIDGAGSDARYAEVMRAARGMLEGG